MRLTDRASAAATPQNAHYPTFLRAEAPASCMRLLGAHSFEIFSASPLSLDPGKQRVGDCAVKNGGEHNPNYGREQIDGYSLVHRFIYCADVVPRHEATNQNGRPKEELGECWANPKLHYRQEDGCNPYQEGKQSVTLIKAPDPPPD